MTFSMPSPAISYLALARECQFVLADEQGKPCFPRPAEESKGHPSPTPLSQILRQQAGPRPLCASFSGFVCPRGVEQMGGRTRLVSEGPPQPSESPPRKFGFLPTSLTPKILTLRPRRGDPPPTEPTMGAHARSWIKQIEGGIAAPSPCAP